MSKKNMESTRELMGTREVTDYSIRTYKNEELVYFLIQPSNISVLSEESLSARIYGPVSYTHLTLPTKLEV